MTPEQHANSATNDNVEVEILKLLQSMQGTLKDLKSNKNNRNNSDNSNNSNNSNNSSRQLFGNGRTDKYCWSHRACNNKSKDFFNKDDGHNDKATFEEKLSVSTTAFPDSWDGGLTVLNSIQHTKDVCYSKTIVGNPATKKGFAKEDIASSWNYWREENINCLQNMIHKKEPDMKLPGSSQTNTTQQCKLPLTSSLSKEASAIVVLPSLKSSSLIALCQSWEDHCRVILDQKKLYVEKDNKLVLEGKRNLIDELWDKPIPYEDVYNRLYR